MQISSNDSCLQLEDGVFVTHAVTDPQRGQQTAAACSHSAEQLEQTAMRIGAGWRLAGSRVSACEQFARQYAALATQPHTFFWFEFVGRAVFCAIIWLAYVWAWRRAGATWLMVAPAVWYGIQTLCELGLVHAYGIGWADTAAGKVSITLHVACFQYVTLFPLFLDDDRKPFASFVATLASAGLLVFNSVAFSATYMIPSAMRKNPAFPRLDVRHHLVFIGAVRAVRFEDVWTDLAVGVLFWRLAERGGKACYWRDAVVRCERYRRMAIANTFCAAGDVAISVLLALGSLRLENAGRRARRCEHAKLYAIECCHVRIVVSRSSQRFAKRGAACQR